MDDFNIEYRIVLVQYRIICLTIMKLNEHNINITKMNLVSWSLIVHNTLELKKK